MALDLTQAIRTEHRPRAPSGFRNKLLESLSGEILATLRPSLHEVDLPSRLVISRGGSRTRDLYFVEEGLVSVFVTAGQESIEVGLVGAEGVIGAPALLGPGQAECEISIHTRCRASQLSLQDWGRHAERHPGLTDLLHNYLQFALAQVCHTSLSAGRGTLEKRLSRWLLMAHDRLPGDVIETTHDHLAASLGVRRPGVTVALHMMEGENAIRSKRNTVFILDRSKLKTMAGPCYGRPERLYERLFGTVLSRD